MPPHPILVDNREKNPLPLPKTLEIWDHRTHPLRPRSLVVEVVEVPQRMETGDYAHGADPKGCIIERKASLTELYQNLCTSVGRKRFLDECHRMREYRRPILLLEGDPLSLETFIHKKVPVPAAVIRDLLFQTTAEFGIWTIVVPTRTISQRRAAGRWVAALLIQETLNAREHRPHP